jgi:hypothetical protein
LEETWLFEQNIYNKEQLLISSAENPNNMVWNLWSRKRRADKIYIEQREYEDTFLLNLECAYEKHTTAPWLVRIYVLA